ncbi:MAG TPA: HlyD family secretion protein [Vicinamibacterales bacterium]|nr:HlyD family secretion protein [Vicinamibacterales bacterium]
MSGEHDHSASTLQNNASALDDPAATPTTTRRDAPPRRSFLRQRGRKKLLIPALIIGLLLIAIVGSLLWRYFGSYETTDDAQVDAHLHPVSARVSGYVNNVNVGDNEYVKAGTVLVEIDPKDYEVALDKARADLANAEATASSLDITVPVTTVSTSSQLASTESDVSNAAAGIVAAEKQLAAAEAQTTEAEANDVKAQDDLKRYKQLVEAQNVSEQTYDQAVAAAKASTASVAAARANAAAAQQTVAQAKSRLTQAEANHRAAGTGPQQVASTRARAMSAAADVKQKQALLEQAELNLQYTKVVAPVDGLVNKTVVVGMNILPGQQLLTIVPIDDVWVTANFKETQLESMRAGQRADVTVDANGRTYRGRIDSIGGATGPLFSLLPPENATGNYVKIVQRIPVKIVLEPGQNNDRQLRPGMSVVPRVFLR